jgi:hypothetical protein
MFYTGSKFYHQDSGSKRFRIPDLISIKNLNQFIYVLGYRESERGRDLERLRERVREQDQELARSRERERARELERERESGYRPIRDYQPSITRSTEKTGGLKFFILS